MASVSKVHHRANQLLATLGAEDFAILEPNLDVVDLPKGKVLYETGDPIRHTYFPHDAIVSLVNVMEDGRFIEVSSFGREGLFGLISALVSRESFGRYKVQIAGTASRIGLSKMHDAINARPRIRRLVLSYTEALLAQTFQTVSCNAVHTVEARCANWILSTRDRVDQDGLPLTHEVLAEMLGVQRSTVSLVLHTLQTAGLIGQSRGVITVKDRVGLEDIACECYGRILERYRKLLPDPVPRS
ncbi:Crp/Fnr family transcriptional regulator [Microvirga massiliensis]|uniref:Crp/Fnr family transcriptional regulator n=1 Tax=Microvirga massiliensis TaxID=1033741 RepID=UPI00062B4BC0|nr:Crp/Fnr family transcriptional regulator [Microvirga massiliensis]